ncbi:MAG TPA: ABC transporter ATP-binding protein [Chitinophagaceae bacterium]|nr:ABC transporter ATP-binding protein [Chitinophagaceae bacterium]HNF71223.1 ABC transporter ATP-binding protein [Chitinophagaceae bacterium]
MLYAKNLCKSYNQLQVLKGISLEISEAEMVSISGASGAGKSTLLHILGTLDRPDSGSLRIRETEVSGLNAKKLSVFRNQHIGFVFQFHHLLPEFSALENVCLPAWIAGVGRKEAEHRAAALFELMNLSPRMHHQPSELSGGEQQRVAIARALINRPAIVFADEPTGNLDTQNSKSIFDLMVSLRDNFKQTLVMVTHNEELARLCDRNLHMIDGFIVP